jgi:ABC-type dipeptide/oligopeptide/nickel transport system permease component
MIRKILAAILVIVANAVVDIVQAWLDPRIGEA